MKRSRIRPRLHPSTNDPALSGAWFKAVVFRGAVCIVCGDKKTLQGHHVISQRAIKDLAKELRWSNEKLQAVLWDRRNGVPLCSRCHERHESAYRRIPRYLLPSSVYRFVHEIDDAAGREVFLARLYREYPQT